MKIMDIGRSEDGRFQGTGQKGTCFSARPRDELPGRESRASEFEASPHWI